MELSWSYHGAIMCAHMRHADSSAQARHGRTFSCLPKFPHAYYDEMCPFRIEATAMICFRILIHRTYVDCGLVKVSEKCRFIIELINLLLMFVTFVLNIVLTVEISQMALGSWNDGWRRWDFDDWDQPVFPGMIVGFNVTQAVVLFLVMANSLHYWTNGKPCDAMAEKHKFLIRSWRSRGPDETCEFAGGPGDHHSDKTPVLLHLPLLAVTPAGGARPHERCPCCGHQVRHLLDRLAGCQ